MTISQKPKLTVYQSLSTKDGQNFMNTIGMSCGISDQGIDNKGLLNICLSH